MRHRHGHIDSGRNRLRADVRGGFRHQYKGATPLASPTPVDTASRNGFVARSSGHLVPLRTALSARNRRNLPVKPRGLCANPLGYWARKLKSSPRGFNFNFRVWSDFNLVAVFAGLSWRRSLSGHYRSRMARSPPMKGTRPPTTSPPSPDSLPGPLPRLPDLHVFQRNVEKRASRDRTDQRGP